MQELLPNGVPGIAVTGLPAAFMAGMAADVSSFHAVVTTDVRARYVQKDRPAAYHLRFGRMITAAGMLASVGTAFVAAGFSNITSYLRTPFSFFGVPMSAVLIIGMFWKRASMKSGVRGLVAGTIAAVINYFA